MDDATQLRFVISVPVGAWNDGLRATFASLAMQTPQPCVALLDASDDPRVAALADEYGDLIAYRRHGLDAGQSAAIAEGWDKVEGDILHWLNVDDALMPGALSSVADAFETDPDADAVYGHSIILDSQGALRGAHPAVDPERLGALPYDCVISQPSCFVRREAIERAGGLDPAFHYAMDWDLWTRLAGSGARFAFLNAYLSQVIWADGTKTARLTPRKTWEMARIASRTGDPWRVVRTLFSSTRQIWRDYHARPLFTQTPFYWRNGTRLPYMSYRDGARGLSVTLKNGADPKAIERLQVFAGDQPLSLSFDGAEAGSSLNLAFENGEPPEGPVWISADEALQTDVEKIDWLYETPGRDPRV